MMPEQLSRCWRHRDLQSTSAERCQSNVTEQNRLFITLGADNGPLETIIIAFSVVLPGGEAGRCCANVSYRGTTMATSELHSCVHNPAFSEKDPIIGTNNTRFCHLLPLHHLGREDKFQQPSVRVCRRVAGSRRREDANIRRFCRLAHSASAIVDQITYLNGELGSCTCCLSSSWTHLEENGVRIGWKGWRRFNRCASVSHHQINGLSLMVGQCCAEVNRNQ